MKAFLDQVKDSLKVSPDQFICLGEITVKLKVMENGIVENGIPSFFQIQPLTLGSDKV